MRNDIAVLYATMTGNSRECAEKTTALLIKAGLPARLHDLARYDPRSLLEETTVVLTISTWGQGEPPDDAVDFFSYVNNLQQSSLCELRFAVFALGDTSYDNFCQCGKDLDRVFAEKGATRFSIASTMMLIFMRRLKLGKRPSSLRCKTPWQLRS